MFLADLKEAIDQAGYDFATYKEAVRYIVAEIPEVGDEIFDQPMSTAQANPEIPDALAFEILDKLGIPPTPSGCP